jgi:hypothetical protein
VIDKRVDIYTSLKQAKEVPNLVGLLYNTTQHKYMSSILKNLQKLSERRDISIICFTLGNVNLQEGLVAGTVVQANSIALGTVCIPKYALNIGCFSKSKNVNRVMHMSTQCGSIVVNPVNTFNQAVIFDVLSAVPAIKECILPVSTLSPSIIAEYLTNSNTVFLIPERGKRNNGAIRIEKHPQNKRNNYSIENGSNRLYCGEKNLFAYIKKIIGNKKYVAVQGKKTLMWNDAPLEARIYAQKGITGKWSVTEMISKNEMFFKDSIYKDTADELWRTLLTIIPSKIEDIKLRLENYSLNICSYLDYYFSNLGNCTVDFIIDKEGMPFIIGFGGWDQKDYLFKLNGKHIWDKYIANSVDYLLYLKYVSPQEGRSI